MKIFLSPFSDQYGTCSPKILFWARKFGGKKVSNQVTFQTLVQGKKNFKFYFCTPFCETTLWVTETKKVTFFPFKILDINLINIWRNKL